MATGRREYYLLARNLLLSYKFHTKKPLPFAIICDRKNSLTRYFDDVVIIDSPTRTYTDKVRILDLSPYDESIFLDADSLAYSDLNELWDFFNDSPPFGILGCVYPLDSDKAWVSVDNAGIFKDRLEFLLTCQGGIYYFRKDELNDFRSTADYILKHYTEFKFRPYNSKPSDEKIFTLACSAHGYRPPHDWTSIFAYYPNIKRINKLDIRSGTLDYVFKWQTENVPHPENGKYILHWGTKGTRTRLYTLEMERLRSKSEGKEVSMPRLIRHHTMALIRQASANIFYGIKVVAYKILNRHKNN